MHIFFSVGEPSGDQHAAHLIEELRRRRPGLLCSGFGGTSMQQAGCQLLYPLTNLAVMGFLRVVPLLWQFYRLLRQAEAYFAESRPDAVVLVDFPGFNWWIARKAKAAGIPVFYYMPPQLWAWAPWRIGRMRKFVDHVLSGLSFEEQWYAERGVDVQYVGHPFFDEVASRQLDEDILESWPRAEPRVVGVLPGSRTQEVARNWPVMLAVIRRLAFICPEVRFLVACYKDEFTRHCSAQLTAEDSELPIDFLVGKTSEIIEAADCCLMVSGSVSLEMLARATPAVVLYRCGWDTYLLGKLLITCKYITLPNLMAGREVLPEFPSVGDPTDDIEQMTGALARWFKDAKLLKQAQTDLAALRDQVASTGAAARTADAILSQLDADPLQKAA
jgi:lipid-A-disaccharide synthase